MGYINAQQLSQLAKSLNGNGYGHYLLDILEDRPPTSLHPTDSHIED